MTALERRALNQHLASRISYRIVSYRIVSCPVSCYGRSVPDDLLGEHGVHGLFVEHRELGRDGFHVNEPRNLPQNLIRCLLHHLHSRHTAQLILATKVCRYSWHSAGSLGWPFPMLKYTRWAKTGCCVSALTAVGRSQLLARWPGTHSRILSTLQRAAQTVLDVYLERTCSRVTSASSALGTHLTIMRAIQIHSLTHSLTVQTAKGRVAAAILFNTFTDAQNRLHRVPDKRQSYRIQL